MHNYKTWEENKRVSLCPEVRQRTLRHDAKPWSMKDFMKLKIILLLQMQKKERDKDGRRKGRLTRHTWGEIFANYISDKGHIFIHNC